MGNESYRYDALDAMTHRSFPSESYLYTADGERLATLRYSQGTSFASETWTLRGLDSKVLRRWEHSLQTAGTLLFADGFESGNTSAWDTSVGSITAPPTSAGMIAEVPAKGDFNGTQGTWLWIKDYIYRNGVMLAAATNEPGNDATVHFAVNHLGTPQVTTNAIGQINEIDHYWGFGGLAGNTEPGNETQRFTGHERDFHLNDNENDDLDYMHARYCSPHLRRFLSVDPARSASPKVPQSWNRYAYALNNPVKFVDPDGEKTQIVYGRQTARNVFGHIAIAVNEQVYSYGTFYVSRGGDWGVDLQSYLAAQNESRETKLITLDVSDEQEARLLEVLENADPDIRDYSEVSNSCVSVCERSLEDSGILLNQPGDVMVTEAGDLLQAGAPSALTPSDLASQIQNQGLASTSMTTGKRVSKVRAFFGTLKQLLFGREE